MRAVLVALTCAVASGMVLSAQPAQDPVLARSRIIITGGGISISPAHQVVPRNMATIVETVFAVPGGSSNGNGDHADLAAAFPPDAILVAELIGPSLGAPVTLTTRAGEPFRIQPLAISGLHFLRGIRLVSGGATLLAAYPDAVTLEVIDRVLVSQVTSRALSADEIRDRGIVIDQTNYQVISFSAAFGFQDRAVRIDFPMIVPSHSSAALAPAAPPLQLPHLQPTVTPAPSIDLPKLVEAFQTANVSVGGLLLKVEDAEIERQFQIPPLSGVIVIPGNIAYLNQFFSILTLVSNAAPGHSNLTAQDVTAEIVLPGGADTVPGSGDDPLRMARLGTPPAEQARARAVTLAGPDGRFGTADDIRVIAPQQSGNSEHLVEGLREGTHTIEVKVSAMLHGLPIGPVPISGRVLGTVEVRNPTFALTLSHPATISAGEEYDLLVTLTNTSRSPANLASVNLLPRSISGATLVSEPSVQIETIAAGDSETATFRLLSHTTGTVTATSFTSEGIPGRFELTTAVGALGIPMSPNTLVLPTAANALPDALRTAGLRFLGQAFALATAPVTPEGLLPLGRQIVYDRGTGLAQAGQRASLQEPLGAIVRDLLLDWTGNEYARLSERFGDGQDAARHRAQQDLRGFDSLLRQSRRGQEVVGALASLLAADFQNTGLDSFHDAWARATVSRAPHLSAVVAASAGTVPLALEILDPDGRRLGLRTPGAALESAVPFSAHALLAGSAVPSAQMLLLSTPQAGAHELAVTAADGGAIDLSVLVPEAGTLRRLTYAGVTMTAGSRASIRFTIGGTNTYELAIDDNGDGTTDRTVAPTSSAAIADEGPRLVAAVQFVTGQDDASQAGQIVALLFSEEISRASSQDGLAPALLTSYAVDANQVLGVALQPGGRVVLLSLRDGIGPFVERTVTVQGIEDRFGNALSPAPGTAVIVPTVTAAGGVISGRVLKGDGSAVPRARIRLAQSDGFGPFVTVSVKDADATGRYTFDFVRARPTRLEALDPESGERGEVHGSIRHNGQQLELDIVLLGTGTVAGRALSPTGAPLRGAVVRVSSLTRFGEVHSAVTDATGAFSITSVPVGNITIEAAHTGTNAGVVRASALPRAGMVVVEELTLVPLVAAAVQTGTLVGQVFRADGSTPAAGVPVFTTRGGVATTDGTGAFRIELLPVGELSLRAIDQTRAEQATVVTTVVAGATITANLRLVGGTATIRGVVLDADGNPVAGAQVGGGAALQVTGSTGEFQLIDVPLGSRTITAVDPATQSTGSASVTLNVPNEIAAIQVVLEARGTIAGRVFDSGGAPVPGLKVFLLGGRNLDATTDATGGYRFAHAPVGSYQVSAFRPDFSDGNIVNTRLTFRGETRVVNLTFRGQGRVTGVVLADNGVTPLGARVGLSEMRVRVGRLQPPENFHCLTNVQVGGQTLELPQCQTVGLGFRLEPLTRVIDNDVATGRFAFEDVLVGSVTVEAANALTPIVMAARGEIEVPGQTVDLQLRLAPTSVVGGVVLTPEGTSAGADVVVTLGGRNVVTDPAGRFTHFEVAPGSFTVTASDPETGLVGRVAGSVAPGVTADMTVRLLGRGTVGIEVRGVNGVVAGAPVRVSTGGYPHETREGVTLPTGRIVFSGGDALFEGPVSVSATDPVSGVTGFASGTIVRDAQLELTIDLPNQSGTVQGRFLNAAGTQPIPNAQIRLASSGGEAYATTLADGSFEFDGVRMGGVTLEAFDPVTARRGRATEALTAHGQVLSLEVRQVAQGSVRGVVRLSTDESAVAAANVTISVSSIFGAQYRTTTNIDGTFLFPGVSAGTFSLSASGMGLSGSASGVLATEAEVVVADVILQVPASGRVEGTVTTASGAPALGAQVSLGSRQTTVDNAGFYFFDDVAMGNLTVRAIALAGPDGGVASGSLVYAGEVATVNVAFVGTGSITGSVRSGGAPVAFALVSLTTRNVSGRSFTATTQSNGEGAYSFAVVPVGDVSVIAVQAGTQLAGAASGAIASNGQAIDLLVNLQSSGAFRARVLRETTNAPAAHMGIEVIGAARRFGATTADGMLFFPDLPLGIYQLIVTDPLGEGIVRTSVTIDQDGEEVDVGDLLLDEANPAVVSITPADGAAQVPVSQAIAIHFSERIAAATVTASNMIVATPAGPVSGAWTVSADLRTATFTPAAPFADFTPVSVKVTTAIRDLVGKALPQVVTSAFLTADSVPPVTLSLSPLAGAAGVQPAATIRVAYSEAINPVAFSGAPIELRLGGSLVPGTAAATLSNTVVVFTPTAPLQPNATYQVAVRPAADVFGNVQLQGTTFTFATIDTLAPVIQQLTADSNGAFEGSSLTVTAAIGESDVARVEFLVNGTVVATDTAAPFQAAIAVTAALSPSFVVSARATDTAGNISSPALLTLEVQSDTAPSAAIITPADGATVDTGATLTLRVRGTDDRGVSRIAYQASGQVSSAGTFAVNPATPTADATFALPVPASAAPGPLLIRAAATDTAGGSSPTVTATVTVLDRTAPSVQILTPATGAGVHAGQTASVVVTAADNGSLASITLQSAGAAPSSETRPIVPGAATAQVTFEIPVPASATETESLTIAVIARDAAGNDSAPATRVFGVIVPDTTAPVVNALVTSSGSTRVLAGETASLRATVSDNRGVTSLLFASEGAVAINNVVIPIDPALTSGDVPLSLTVPADVANGASVTVTVRATDAAGNLSQPVSLTLSIGDTAVPQVAVLAPAAGAAFRPGQTVTFTVRATDDLAVRRIAFTATGVFTASGVQEIDPPTTTAERSFVVALPAGTPAGSLTLTAEAFDQAGNSSGAIARTVIVEDIIAPAVSVVAPAAGASIDPGSPVQVTIEATDAVGVTSVTLTATGATSFTETRAVEPAAVSRSEGFTVTFAVPPAAGGTLTLSATARDAAGNVGQATAVAVTVLDVIAPTIASVTPADGATGVDPSSGVVVQFTESMDAATVTAANLAITREGAPVSAALTLTSDGRTATLTPQSPLGLGAQYTITAGVGLADRAGNPFTAARIFSFTTAAPDTTGPRIQATSPVSGALDVPLSSVIEVTFTEPVAVGSVSPASFRVAAAGSFLLGTFTFASGDTRVRFTPTSPLPPDAAVLVELTSAITDVAGNPLADSSGAPLTTPFTFTFATGRFGITSPRADASVVENSAIAIEAQASPSLGVGSVVFTVNGEVLPAITAAPFRLAFQVPALATHPTLTIVASARNAQNAEIATDTRTVPVGLGLAIRPTLSGVPLGGVRHVRLVLSSAASDSVSVQLRAGDPAVVTFPVNPVVIPAGHATVEAAVQGASTGNTAIFAESSHGNAYSIVSVGAVAAETEVNVSAMPAGASVRVAASAGTVIGNTSESFTVSLAVLPTAAAASTPVSIISTNPLVATATVSNVAAGGQTATIVVTTGTAGTATLVIRAGDEVRSLTVIVGGGGSGALPMVASPLVGAAVRRGLPAGHVIFEGAGQSTLTVPLLADAASAAMPVSVDSSDPAVVTASAGPIGAGMRTTSVAVTAQGNGRATLIFRAGGQTWTLEVIVGPSSAAQSPVVLAPPVGASVIPAPGATVFAPTGAGRTLSVRALAQPAAANTVVIVSSSDPAVATVESPAMILAGEQVVALSLNAGLAGRATLTIDAGGVRTSLDVRVGTEPGASAPGASAPAVGASVTVNPTLGRVFAPANLTSAPTLVLPVLATAAGAPVSVVVTTSHPSVVGIGAAASINVIVAAGQQTLELPLSIPGVEGVSVITFEFEGQRRQLLVIVGNPPASQIPALSAPLVGVEIR